jgi:Sec-independent protein translocase protein TatA
LQDEFGHTDVATSNKMKELYGDLGEWINMVKCEVKKFEHRPSTTFMTEEEVEKMEDLGLNLHAAMAKASEEDWDDMFEKLKQFAHDNGHTRVPTAPASLLSRWVEDQRKEYKKMKAGKNSILNAERISKLTSIGFELGRELKRRRFEENCKYIHTYFCILLFDINYYQGSQTIPIFNLQPCYGLSTLPRTERILSTTTVTMTTSESTLGAARSVKSIGIKRLERQIT